MISPDLLKTVATDLAAFRGNGRQEILFDSRDRSNYGAYAWESTCAMLNKVDPTGLSIGLLLHEMINATIQGSQVKLERVICEDGFLAKISQILSIKARLLSELKGPMDMLMERVNMALTATAGELGQATTREVAICLRDAVYSIERGLSLRWLECTDASMNERVPICNTVSHFQDIAAFSDALRHTLPWGAHLARIGVEHTAIGIKQPGKVAFLSSMAIDRHTGGMREDRAHGHHMAESLDLDTAVERYPNWVNVTFQESSRQKVVVHGRETHELDQLGKLPRDRLIWMAMLVEIACQRMASTNLSSVELAESIERALPPAEANKPGIERQTLPMVITPNWTASGLSIEKALDNLQFTPWERQFFAPALAGLPSETFLPYGNDNMTMNIETRLLTTYEAVKPSFRGDSHWVARHLKITPMRTDWVGTRSETEAARKCIFERNLAKYLLKWGNFHFEKAWVAQKDWFKQKLEGNLDCALRSSCVKLVAPDYVAHHSVHLYSQSAKHRTYNARCYFSPKKLVTHVAQFAPQCDTDLIEMFDLQGQADLPEFLRGWSRSHGWTTDHDSFKNHEVRPVDITDRWDFSEQKNHILEATLCLNESSLDADLRARLLGPEKEGLAKPSLFKQSLEDMALEAVMGRLSQTQNPPDCPASTAESAPGYGDQYRSI